MSPDGQRISDWLAKGQGLIEAETADGVLEKAYGMIGKKHMSFQTFRDRLALAGYQPQQRHHWTGGVEYAYYALVLPEHFSR